MEGSGTRFPFPISHFPLVLIRPTDHGQRPHRTRRDAFMTPCAHCVVYV